MNRSIFLTLLLLVIFIFGNGCSGNKNEKKTSVSTVNSESPVIGNETSLLLKDLAENGDYVKSKLFPSLIKSSVFHADSGKKTLVVDLRSTDLFSKGHIKDAVNKQFRELPEYFETGIKPFEFDKIILVCSDGQISSYTASLLRLMGYGNVYALRWGMSGWNKTYARDGWMKNVSGKFEDALEVTANNTPTAKKMPLLETSLTTGKEIGDARFRKLFEEGTDSIQITADEIFRDPGKYYIINLDRKDKYDDGHIPGAVRYKPESTLGFSDEMATIPTDKTVVVYCGTGHLSGFATAYLRLFGYDARTLKYGNNGFMHDKMVKQKKALSWLPFTLDDSNDFPVVK